MKKSYNKFIFKKVKNKVYPVFTCIGCDFYTSNNDCRFLCNDFKHHFRKRWYIKVYEYIKGLFTLILN